LANLPFAFVKTEEFHKILREAFPNCQILRRQTIPDLLSASALHAASELRQELAANESKVSLAMDVWTTRNNLAFLGMFLWW